MSEPKKSKYALGNAPTDTKVEQNIVKQQIKIDITTEQQQKENEEKERQLKKMKEAEKNKAKIEKQKQDAEQKRKEQAEQKKNETDQKKSAAELKAEEQTEGAEQKANEGETKPNEKKEEVKDKISAAEQKIKEEKERKEKIKKDRVERIKKWAVEEQKMRDKEEYKLDTESQALSVIFSGHVDHGKSSMSGHLMVNLGQIDDRQVEKFKQEAAKTVGESWAYAFALDACQEEREKGKTVESARATFKTQSGRRIVLLDSPGHKGFIKSMIEAAAQADVAVLVTSARKGEFEAGLERNGQTAEHALILYVSGVKNIIVAVNKMDDPTCCYDQARFDLIQTKLKAYLTKSIGFEPNNIQFVPVSALQGENLTQRLSDGHKMGWYQGPCLTELIDTIKVPKRDINGFLRACVSGKYQDMGYYIVAKLEKGVVKKGDVCIISPQNEEIKVLKIEDEVGNEIKMAYAGENCRIQINEANYEKIVDGTVVCDKKHPCETAKKFIAKFMCTNHPSVMSIGFLAVLHINTTTIQCKVINITGLDKETGKVDKNLPKFLKPGQTGLVEFELNEEVCINKFDYEPFLGRLIVRCEQDTIGMGFVVKLCYD